MDRQLAVQAWDLNRLVPYARNPRTHSDAQIAQIAASIREFGFNNPVLLDPSGGIIAGHGRVLAARQLHLTQIPVIVLDHLSANQKRAFMLADNKLALNAGWDSDMLRLELEPLVEQDFPVELTGFVPDELNELIAEQTRLVDEDTVPEKLEQAVAEQGDLWLLGDHRLLCGDGTSVHERRPYDPGRPVCVLYRPNPRRSRLAGTALAKDQLPAFQPPRGGRTAHKRSPDTLDRTSRRFC